MYKLKRLFISSFLLVFAFFSVFTLKSFADQYVVKPSITMTSSNTSFSSNEGGSWQMTKSAKWIAKNKAQIKFEVESKQKSNYENLDVMLVLDNSGSMGGQPLAKIKSDANEAIDTILSNSNNRISLVTFNSTSDILSNWSNDATNIKNLVNSINDAGGTNYYSGFKSAEAILDGTAGGNDKAGGTNNPYTKQSNRDLVMIFMSDGQPNEKTPNEVGEYNFLKTTYPHITINAIQYNMGEDFILEPLKVISDNQFISNANSSTNVLQEATITPYTYDQFILTDFLNDDYWDSTTIDKVIQILSEATSTNTGTLNPTNVTINTSATPPTIKWDLSGIYRSGSKATLTLEVTLKDEYKDQGGLYPTNKGTTIESELPDTPDEDVSTIDTPVLKGDYKITYDINKPSSCALSPNHTPPEEEHAPFQTVEIDGGIPTCTDPNNSQNNYEFKGWEIVNPTNPDTGREIIVAKLGDDYFTMPEADVTLKAIWTRPSISKAMDGTVVEDKPAYFDTGRNVVQKMKRLAGNSSAIYSSTNTNIKSIKAADSLPAGFTPTSDNTVSTSSSPLPIYMWFDNTNDQGIIYYYTDAAPDQILINTNSSSMFYNCTSLTDLSGLSTWDTSSVTTMSDMFNNCRSLTDLSGLSTWDTSSVTYMSYMFYNCRSLTDLTPLANWNTSSVTKMFSMFNSCRSLTDLSGLSTWNTSSVTNMSGMFRGDSVNMSLTELTPLANWNTSSVTDMSYMFYNCRSLTDLSGLSTWNTSSITNMSYMFYNCRSLTDLTPLANWNTSSVTDMSYMFFNDNNIDATVLNGWDVSNVTDKTYAFSCPTNMRPSWY